MHPSGAVPVFELAQLCIAVTPHNGDHASSSIASSTRDVYFTLDAFHGYLELAFAGAACACACARSHNR
jgi:hypothetical protein